MTFAVVIYIISLFFIPQILGPVFIPGLYVSLIITMVGIGMFAMGSLWRTYYRHIKIMQANIQSPITVTKKYAVTKHGNTYIFTDLRGSYGLNFVALKQGSIGPADEIHIPRNIWKSSTGAHFEGLRVANVEGTFSIPTPEGNIISGDGILLVVSTYHPSYARIGLAAVLARRTRITRENLLKVAEYADRYVSQRPDDGLNSSDF